MTDAPSTAPPAGRPAGPAPAGGTLRLGAAPADLERAAALLRAGGLVAFPTETVYGLGADAGNAAAVAALYAAKGRPAFNPLIAHVPDLAHALALGSFSRLARRLAEAFWPGPLTLVVPAAGDRVCALARAGLGSVAVRVPGHAVARDLLLAAGRPVVAPSANRSGRISPTRAAHVALDLDGRIDAIVDGGRTRVGVESTIVSCLEERPRLLRPGGLGREALEEAIGTRLAGPETDGPETDGATPIAARPLVAPGLLLSHYAPRALVRVEARAIEAGDAALLFGGAEPAGLAEAVSILNLSPAGDLLEAAANLFDHLHRLDGSGARRIAVSPIPNAGLGEAINDRLRRAAAERP